MGDRANIGHNLLGAFFVPVPLHNPHPHRLASQGRIDEIDNQEGLARVGNVGAVLLFHLVLRLIGVEMDYPLSDLADTGVVFSAGGAMGRGHAGVGQYASKQQSRRSDSCPLCLHGEPSCVGPGPTPVPSLLPRGRAPWRCDVLRRHSATLSRALPRAVLSDAHGYRHRALS